MMHFEGKVVGFAHLIVVQSIFGMVDARDRGCQDNAFDGWCVLLDAFKDANGTVNRWSNDC